MRKAKKPPADDLIEKLRTAIVRVIDNPNSLPGELRWAIEAGIKLAMMERKLGDGGKDGSFFGD